MPTTEYLLNKCVEVFKNVVAFHTFSLLDEQTLKTSILVQPVLLNHHSHSSLHRNEQSSVEERFQKQAGKSRLPSAEIQNVDTIY